MERTKEIEARMKEISKLIEQPDSDLEALEAEVRNLKTEQEEIEKRSKKEKICSMMF